MHRTPDTEPLPQVWQRLAPRVARSAERGRQLITVLRDDIPVNPLGDGARVHDVYAAVGPDRRRGQSERLRLVDLAHGAACSLPLLPGTRSEWMVLGGEALVDGEPLRALDHHLRPAGAAELPLSSPSGARLLVRESRPDSGVTERSTRRAADSAWERFPGGIGRRRLGQAGSEHTYLLRLEPGGRLPVHRHAHDEECLLVEGEMFVEDRLLRSGDYQVAPEGVLHMSISSDVGALVWIHGDAEPDLVRPAGR